MSALALLSLVLPLPALFVLHDVEEAVVQHRWMLSHEAALRAQFPRLQPLITHLLQYSHLTINYGNCLVKFSLNCRSFYTAHGNLLSVVS